MSLVVIATTFGLILPAELPDKTLVATLVLATRYRPWPVWIGVTLAFAVQSLTAVLAGGLLARLPRQPVLAATAVLFAVGSALMLFGRAEEDEEPGAADASEPPSTRRIVTTSFAVLFAAEWGDFSQLLTAGLAARFDDPISVFIGSWAALGLIAGIAVVAGQGLVRVIPLGVVRRIAGLLFGTLAVITAVEAVRA